ncbi:Phage Tail Protein X [Pseudovibrio axinellae]|uniref:Phage Tail Protein X n=1 Tax=Pseudovibrio axinellae TaxID=989403 RepID=A0A165XHI0_9HYPH|nr:tail protein X [Pseudovibrio axinellae]KZL17704.1 Phage Tail Protein X [Pseudovibrio axinellae]SER42959.1 P2-like prophage tail protein X [Pseudovibrio axinellae]
MDFIPLENGNYAYRAIDGDAVDLIAFQFYGHHDGTLELVLNANRGLAAKGPVLSVGDFVILPPEPPRKVTRMIRLWD